MSSRRWLSHFSSTWSRPWNSVRTRNAGRGLRRSSGSARLSWTPPPERAARLEPRLGASLLLPFARRIRQAAGQAVDPLMVVLHRARHILVMAGVLLALVGLTLAACTVRPPPAPQSQGNAP